MPVEDGIEKMCKLRRPLRCKYCPISFANLDSYRQHTIKHKRKYLKCYQIQHKTHLARMVVNFEIYDDGESVENHRENKTTGRMVTRDIANRRCNRCCVLFRNRQELEDHMQTEHSGYGFVKEAIKSLTCPRCLKDFVYHSDFTTKKKCSCPFCKIYFEQVIDEDGEEMNKVLTSPFDCPKCNEIYQKDNKIMPNGEETGGKFCKKHLNLCKCPVCRRKFRKPHFLKFHMRVHSKKQSSTKQVQVFRCETCNRGFKEKRYLQNHKYRGPCTAPQKTPFYCEMCEKYFKNSRNLTIHYRSIHTKKAVRCQYCKNSTEMFLDKTELMEHHQKVHRNELGQVNKRKSLENDSEHKRLKYDGQLLNRSKIKHDGKPQSETTDKFQEDNRLLQCQLCPKFFKGKHFLVDHYKRIHKVDHQWVYTKFANMADRPMKSKKSKKSKKHHHKSKHKEHRSHPVTEMDFASTSLQKFVNGNDLSHQCELCPARYESRKGMLQHMRRKHSLSNSAIPLDKPHSTGIGVLMKDYKCHLCHQTFVMEESLKQHIVQKHNHDGGHGSLSGKFKCGYCYLAFGDRNQLSRHMISNHLNI